MSSPAVRVIEGSGERAAARADEPPGLRTAMVVPGAGWGRRFVASALQSAGAWLVEPAEPAAVERGPAVQMPPLPPPVVAVFGLATGCGGTVVARALAAELAARDTGGAAAVACEARASGIPLATQAASRLARALEDLPGASTRAVGRLCLIGGTDPLTLAECSRQVAPLVLDAGSRSLGGVAASVADHAVVVATPSIEPALARVAAECLARVGTESTVVVNRARPATPRSPGEDDGARGEDAGARGEHDGAPSEAGGAPAEVEGAPASPGFLHLPDSRLGAQLALGGREARGALGRAILTLADLCSAGGSTGWSTHG